ncbi:MAG: Gfo/Idh/MocA family oxidoreductase [Acidobacteriota bacterium]|nr:Gfo/Idh/MocA family oxidoreductase [Acidobacteriota bacterium]
MSTDYTQAGRAFKIRKALRYVRLFGFKRTIAKVRGQYHIQADKGFTGGRWVNPSCRDADAPGRQVALIGCGNYAFANIAYYLAKRDSTFLRYTFDSNPSRSRSLCETYGGAYAAGDWREILTDDRVKIVFIASNHASHADYAVACIEAGKHVHIEKPHVVSDQQLDRLLSAMQQHPESKVFLGFNRPRSPLFHRLQALLAAESGPLMINWFIAGHEIPEGHWYFNEEEGGRVLGNLCHWTDLTLHLVTLDKAFPCRIVPATPAGAKSDFVVSVMFAEGSCASITFSAKGHTFEGVREVLNLHKGNVLATLTDFQTLAVHIVERRLNYRRLHRDHGHQANIVNSASGADAGGAAGEDAASVAATARFFLAIREAIETGHPVDLSRDALRGGQ